MNRTQVAREVADSLHATEASLEATLESARQTLERMIVAKAELGLTGTMGDAAIARVRDALTTLEDAYVCIGEGHQEAYTVLKATNIRGTAVNPWPTLLTKLDEIKASRAA